MGTHTPVLARAYEYGLPLNEHLEQFVRFAKSRLGDDTPNFRVDGLKGATVTDQKVVTFVKTVGSELYRDLWLDATVDGKALAICGSISPSNVAVVPHGQGVAMLVGQPMSTAKSRRQAVGVGELALERWVKKSYNGTCRRTQPAAQTQLGAAR